MNKLIQYTKRFLRDENGSELVQWAVVVAIAVMLAAVAVGISQAASSKLDDAKDFIDQLPIPSTPSSP